MIMKKYILLMLLLPFAAVSAWSQVDRQHVRKGDRDYRKENWREAEIDYRKALVKDSMSVAATYNLASTLYREGDPAQAQKVLEGRKDVAATSADAADSGCELYQSMPAILYPKAENITVTCQPGSKVSQYCKKYGIPEV